MNTSAPSSKVRAVICDIYGTLLKVQPPPADAPERWLAGCRALLPHETPLPLPEFNARCRAEIASDHERLRAAGEPYPEVDWLLILTKVLPGLHRPGEPGRGTMERAAQLSALHAASSRTCTAMPGSMETLDQFRSAGILLGIASNAQDYTRGEFTRAGFHFDHFDEKLILLSGEHGFAKPSPRVFTFLTKKLAARGISPEQILMIGDSPENDIAPAAAAGWQTRLIEDSGWRVSIL